MRLLHLSAGEQPQPLIEAEVEVLWPAQRRRHFRVPDRIGSYGAIEPIEVAIDGMGEDQLHLVQGLEAGEGGDRFARIDEVDFGGAPVRLDGVPIAGVATLRRIEPAVDLVAGEVPGNTPKRSGSVD